MMKISSGPIKGMEEEKKYGLNRITARRGTSAGLKFLRQFHAPLVCILLAAVEANM